MMTSGIMHSHSPDTEASSALRTTQKDLFAIRCMPLWQTQECSRNLTQKPVILNELRVFSIQPLWRISFLKTLYKSNFCGKVGISLQHIVTKLKYYHNILKYAFSYSHFPQSFPQGMLSENAPDILIITINSEYTLFYGG